jgi:alpha-galactosidase
VKGSARKTALGLSIAVVLLAGCKKNEEPKSQARTVSAIAVQADGNSVRIKTPNAEFVLEPPGNVRGSIQDGSSNLTLAENGPGIELRTAAGSVTDITRDLAHSKVENATGKLGELGKLVTIQGKSASTGLQETLTLEAYDDFPSLVLISASYRNSSDKPQKIESVSLAGQRLNANLSDAKAKPNEMYAFFGSSLKWGKDDVVAIPTKFKQENPFGAPVETGDDLGRVGGGIPVVAFWNRNTGLAIGHIETVPLPVSIPVNTTPEGRVEASVRVPAETSLQPGETFSTPRAFVIVYRGDYYEPLHTWSAAVEREGLTRPKLNEENYAVSWCGWGYESDVTPKQMVDTIPKLKELGIHWATLDDRWFNNYGDWEPRNDTFPADSMQKLVKDFHDRGVKVQLWWLPLAVEDGSHSYGNHKYATSAVLKNHPDWLILNEHGKPARMTRNLATLCPAVPAVREYYKQLTEKFIKMWDFDGHKLDNVYSTPKCYNPKHHHKSPYDSVNAMGDVYKTIFETTRALKADSVTQSCPCGTPPSLAWFRYMDQAVTADPVGSVQVRRRMKMYKALLGPSSAIYGDHVELTEISQPSGGEEQDTGSDFASTLGTGGVLGTKFTWPDYGKKFSNVYLNAQKEPEWKKWIGLYNEKMLSKGEFLNLYVYGYDVPEGYAISKGEKMYYAFYAPEPPGKSGGKTEVFRGQIELRGLAEKRYRVVDYVKGKDYGDVKGPVAKLSVDFTGSLLLEAVPAQLENGARK